MINSYLIVGMEGNNIQRSLVNSKSKLLAIKAFVDTYPKFLIISVCRLDKQEAEFISQYNMPDCEELDLYGRNNEQK